MDHSHVSRRSFAKCTAVTLPTIIYGGLCTNDMTQPVFGQVPSRIRVGQIGTKHAHAVGKLESVRKLGDVFEVIGVAEEDTKRREQVQNTAAFKDLTWMTSGQLLEQPGLQLVLVETEIEQLLSTAEQCLFAGAHIHLDKPAGASMSHFRRVAAIAAAKQRMIQMGYMFRSNPAFKFLFDAVKKGWLGEIFEVHGVISKQIAPSERAELARYRGGSMFELGCHLIDAVVKLLGKPTSVVAANRNTHPELDQLNDNCLAVFHYPKATATVRSSVVEVDGGRRRQFTVCGTHGTAEIEPLEPPRLLLTLDQPRGEFRKGTQVVDFPKMDGRYDGELLSFASAIRGEQVFEYSLEHDVAVQACVLQASEMS